MLLVQKWLEEFSSVTTFEFSYELENLDRIGLSFSHISNANIGDNLIQKMEWQGKDPRTALINRVNAGINAAESSLSE